MNSNDVKQQLITLTYNDETDAVTLRYLVLHLLAQYASAYREIAGTGEGMALLQHFKKLETAHTAFKEKHRNNIMTEYDFRIIHKLALEHAVYCFADKMLKHAA